MCVRVLGRGRTNLPESHEFSLRNGPSTSEYPVQGLQKPRRKLDLLDLKGKTQPLREGSLTLHSLFIDETSSSR